MALLESVALGTPFVSTVVGGSRMLGRDEKIGAVFETDDEAVREIIRFSEMDINDVRIACEETIKDYDLPGYIQRIEDVIHDVLSEGYDEDV